MLTEPDLFFWFQLSKKLTLKGMPIQYLFWTDRRFRFTIVNENRNMERSHLLTMQFPFIKPSIVPLQCWNKPNNSVSCNWIFIQTKSLGGFLVCSSLLIFIFARGYWNFFFYVWWFWKILFGQCWNASGFFFLCRAQGAFPLIQICCLLVFHFFQLLFALLAKIVSKLSGTVT